MDKTEIIVATGNRGKLKEIRQICSDLPVFFSSLADHWAEVPDIQETGSTFLQNARIKARWVFERQGIWTLADDSGLEVDALNGEPGVRSARYAGENATDQQNCDLL
ncbi:MAG: non-canonical purine NTP pyrophosphatase, partial [Chitinivibrionales bacterium]